ncbi:hypothetical protein X975_01870, partial [Stegodyphus mimosarum]
MWIYLFPGFQTSSRTIVCCSPGSHRVCCGAQSS